MNPNCRVKNSKGEMQIPANALAGWCAVRNFIVPNRWMRGFRASMLLSRQSMVRIRQPMLWFREPVDPWVWRTDGCLGFAHRCAGHPCRCFDLIPRPDGCLGFALRCLGFANRWILGFCTTTRSSGVWSGQKEPAFGTDWSELGSEWRGLGREWSELGPEW